MRKPRENLFEISLRIRVRIVLKREYDYRVSFRISNSIITVITPLGPHHRQIVKQIGRITDCGHVT